MSTWLVITMSTVAIAVSLALMIVFFLLRRENVEEKQLDETFLKTKQDLLRLAVDQTLKEDTNDVLSESSALVTGTEAVVKDTVNPATQKLNDLVSRQRQEIKNIKTTYDSEMKKIRSYKKV
jgi:hypothetical protein